MDNVEFESFAGLQEYIEAFLNGIPGDLYRRVFDDWIERLKRIIEHNEAHSRVSHKCLS
jgi:hypothetical protein